MTPSGGVRYRTFAPRGQVGGELVTVFTQATGDLCAQARAAGTPLSAFITPCENGEVAVQVLTSGGDTPTDDPTPGYLAALKRLAEQGLLSDWALLTSPTSTESTSAQLCGGIWLLSQGQPRAETCSLSAETLALLQGWPVQPEAAQLVQTTLLLPLPNLPALQNFLPDSSVLSELGRLTGCAGLVLYVPAAPPEPALRRADVSLRTFDLPEGREKAVSSHRCACLIAGLGARGLWPEESSVLRAAQLAPGQPALLTAQFSEVGETVWVGGHAEPLPSELS